MSGALVIRDARSGDEAAIHALLVEFAEFEKLIHEQATIQGTIELHCKGLIKCNLRILDIEAELKQMEVAS